MLNYDFLSPQQFIFGWGRRSDAGRLAATLGRRAFLVTGSRTLERTGRLDELTTALAAAGVVVVRLACIDHEPEISDVDEAAVRVREHGVQPGDLVVGIGGGSGIDLAKAVSAMATNSGGRSVRDFLEGVGAGLEIAHPPLPMLAIPTTAGTGSEATKNAVISSYDPPFKKSLRSHQMVPRIVLVDPELSVTVPASVTAHSGLDAVTQLIESYISRRARPIPQALCREGLSRAIPAIVEAVEHPDSRPAREAMAHAALMSGLALANSGLGMAHGVAAALGSHCRVSHGLACAVMLPVALRVNCDVSLPRLAELGRLLGADPADDDATAAACFIDGIDGLIDRLKIPRRLSQLGVRAEQLDVLVQGSRGNSMDGNPRKLSDDELRGILEALL